MNGVRKAKRKGRDCPQTNHSSSELREVYITSYLSSLLQDAKVALKGHYSNADCTRDLIRLKSRMRSEGLGFATKMLPCLIKGLLDLLEHGSASFPQFKLKRGTEHPAFLGRLFHLAMNSTDPGLRTTAFDLLYTVSVAFKKLKGDYPKKVIRKMFADFVKVDRELESINWFSEPLEPIMDDARRQWRNFVDHSGLRSFIATTTPQPGPGATNHPTKKTERYRPHVFYKQLDSVMPYYTWFYPNCIYTQLPESELRALKSIRFNSPTARYKTVPKTVEKPRGICIEENETQVLQQAIRKAFYKAISRYFGDNIALRKQSVNAELALKSSITRDDATIDKSEASDRVARELVSWLSQDDVEIHNLLMGLSTRYVVPPEEAKDEYENGPVKTLKYAPMGSALCFPVMSLVHMFLIRAIIRLSALQNNKTLAHRVFVYGDDVILPVEAIDAVYTYLPMFGMKLNFDKSFYRSHFRESCGVHAYHGMDVTPVYVKNVPLHNDHGALASHLAVEEQLFNKGFFNAARYQRFCVGQCYDIKLSTVPSGASLAGYTRSFDLEALRRFKLHSRRKRNWALQCDTFHVCRLKKKTVDEVIPSQQDAYLRWLWMHTEESEVVGDSYGDLIPCRRSVPESTLTNGVLSSSIDSSIQRFPTLNSSYLKSRRGLRSFFSKNRIRVNSYRLAH